MNSKQLANVLIKVLGFSICLYAIPGFVCGIMAGLLSTELPAGSNITVRTWSYAGGAAVQAVVGILCIVNTPGIVRFLFKREDD
jgi:hypothetical protein